MSATIEMQGARSGETATWKQFAVNSTTGAITDTVLASGSATEATNAKGVYSLSTSETGLSAFILFDASSLPFFIAFKDVPASGAVVASNTFREEVNLNATVSSRSTLAAADVRSAVGLATDNLDTQLAAIPAAVEAAIINEGDATALLQAIADKISADWTAGDLSALAIVSAIKADSTLAQMIGRIDAAVTSRSAPGAAMTLESTERVKLHATQSDYAPAKAGDAMALADDAIRAGAFQANSITATAIAPNAITSSAVADSAVAKIWAALSSGLSTVGSIGKRIVDYLTGDSFARLGAPTGASIAADIAGISGGGGGSVDSDDVANAVVSRLTVPVVARSALITAELITTVEGDDFTEETGRTFTWEAPDAATATLTGATAKFIAKRGEETIGPITGSINDSGSVPIVSFEVTADHTDDKAGKAWSFHAWIELTGGEVITVAKGHWEISRRVRP